MIAVAILAGTALDARASQADEPSSSARPGLLANPDYVGDIAGSPRGRIRIKVVEHRSGDRGGTGVELRRLERICEGGTEARSSLIAGGLPGRDGRFEVRSVQEPDPDVLDNALTLVEGRFKVSGGVSGFIFSAYDPDDGASGPENLAECWSDGLVRFHAKPTQGSGSGDSIPSAGNASTDWKRGKYEGTLGSSRQPVKLKVSGRGRSGRARFEGTLNIDCEFLEHRQFAIGPVRVPLRRDGRFRFTHFSQDPVTLDRSFTRIAGKVKPNGRASGYVSSLFDPWDPFGDTNESECSDPYAGWRAKRRN